MVANKILYTVIVFYVTLISLTGLFGISSQEVTFPTFPDIPVISSIPVLGLIVEFVAWIGLVVAFLFNIIKFSFTDFIPVWLNVIIFVPPTIYIIFETVARLGRGS